MVEQFGLEIIPSCPSIACALTSGTTRGISGSLRKQEVLSTPTQPDDTAFGAKMAETLPPAEKKPTSIVEKSNSSSLVTRIDFPLKLIVLPADRSLASGNNLPTGKLRCSRILIIASPTAPVAPTTATFMLLVKRVHSPKTDEWQPNQVESRRTAQRHLRKCPQTTRASSAYGTPQTPRYLFYAVESNRCHRNH